MGGEWWSGDLIWYQSGDLTPTHRSYQPIFDIDSLVIKSMDLGYWTITYQNQQAD